MSAPRGVRHFVVIGDSMSEGVGDPRPDGTLRGWADRLAEGLQAVDRTTRYTNLAVSGLVTRQIRETQLEAALALEPDLVGAAVGMNDLIRPRMDAAALAAEVDALVGALASRAVVLTGTLPDPTRLLPLPPPVARVVRRRREALNDAVRAASARHGTILFDLGDGPEGRDPALWSVDRLHPGPVGHRVIAEGFAALLSERLGLPPIPVDPEPAAPPPALSQWRWLGTYGLPWLARGARAVVLGPRRGDAGPRPRSLP